MGQRLENKVALITGGTSGIGEATAELFAAEGAKVVITGRSEEKGAGIAERLGENVLCLRADVMQEQDIEASVNFTVERFGKLDVLFNNAGGPVGAALDQISQQHIDYAVRLLLSSVILGIRYAVAPMKANGGGVIINNSSVAAIRSGQGDALYSAVKAAVTHYSKLAGVELGPFGIRVNVISPGAIATPIFWGGSARANTLSDEENARKLAKLKRNLSNVTTLSTSGLAEDVAEAALYLASDAGRFVNCHDLVVDGGRTSMFNEKPEA
jgi:NAD(P)-dependent dehydrogenase (short-subunit alcohol dehydrogenase family)